MKKLFILALALVFSLSVYAQAKEWGRVSASLESLDHFYVKDAVNGFVPSDLPQFGGKDGVYASNNFLKVDYFWKGLSAGLQVEGFFPSTVGYPIPANRLALSNLYVDWRGDSFSVTAGTFYDQLGSGLLFRSWEDRALGLNNSIMGARVAYHFRDIVSVKALWGLPRFGMKFSDTQVKGADASFAISNLVGWQRVYLAVEGSVLDRYEKLSAAQEAEQLNPNRLGYSARLNFDIDGFFLKGEYVNSGTKYFDNLNYGAPGFEDDPKYAEAILDMIPDLRNIYNEETGFKMMTFHLEDATAVDIAMMGDGENLL